jgi:hypothetical protein
MKWIKWVLAVALPGGAGLGFYWALKKSDEVKQATIEAIAMGGTFEARLTGYWPFAATPSEIQMEGGVNDRKGKPLHTLEDVQAGKAPYVSVSGDDAIFPYGQRLQLDVWPGVVFRVVDTGSHFRGATKIYRVAGREPLDICVATKDSVVPKLAEVTIVKGDHFDKPGKEIATTKFQGQTVTV